MPAAATEVGASVVTSATTEGIGILSPHDIVGRIDAAVVVEVAVNRLR
jgi:hypothetical protein